MINYGDSKIKIDLEKAFLTVINISTFHFKRKETFQDHRKVHSKLIFNVIIHLEWLGMK